MAELNFHNQGRRQQMQGLKKKKACCLIAADIELFGQFLPCIPILSNYLWAVKQTLFEDSDCFHSVISNLFDPMVPVCFNLYSRACAKRKMDPLRLKRGWQILANSSAVMTPASARHCAGSKNTWQSFNLTRPLRCVSPLISWPLGSKDDNKSNLEPSELAWLQAIWVITTF